MWGMGKNLAQLLLTVRSKPGHASGAILPGLTSTTSASLGCFQPSRQCQYYEYSSSRTHSQYHSHDNGPTEPWRLFSYIQSTQPASGGVLGASLLTSSCTAAARQLLHWSPARQYSGPGGGGGGGGWGGRGRQQQKEAPPQPSMEFRKNREIRAVQVSRGRGVECSSVSAGLWSV